MTIPKRFKALSILLRAAVISAFNAVVIGVVFGGGVWLVQTGWADPRPYLTWPLAFVGGVLMLLGALGIIALVGAFFKRVNANVNKLEDTR